MSEPAVSAPAPSPAQSGGGTAWYIVALVVGVLLTLVGLGVLSAGIAAAAFGARQAASDGYFVTDTGTLTTASHALTSPRIDGFTEEDAPSELPFDVARVRISAESTTGEDVFIGLAPQRDVDNYLQDVARTVVAEIETDPFRVLYREFPGSRTPDDPDDQAFWAESASGAGQQELTWSVQPGDWAVVVMNADASRGVSVDVQAGVRSDLLVPLALGLIIAGLLMLIVGVPLIVLGAVGLGRRLDPRPRITSQPEPADPVAVGNEDRPYPARLVGWIDPALSRWLWIVKWLLAIPHFILLVGLWTAFVVTTVIAGFAILFTGRYPRSLFAFNVGVLRWNWRVTFYAYSALATDRYPPFTLEHAEYPADFEVDYPERLSNGLVLVKWWLLAIPQYVIVAALTGAAGWWWSWGAWRGRWWFDNAGAVGGISLLSALVLIAAVILLFTGRYRVRLFELIMGINRWVYRVATYAALMRDEYPPFRLDQGPVERQRVDC